MVSSGFVWRGGIAFAVGILLTACARNAFADSADAPAASGHATTSDSAASEAPVTDENGDVPSSGIQNDPFAWLEGDLTCDQLTDQIRGRYAPLGKFSELPPEKKEELRRVLATACSERFASCQFKACANVRAAEAGSETGAEAKAGSAANPKDAKSTVRGSKERAGGPPNDQRAHVDSSSAADVKSLAAADAGAIPAESAEAEEARARQRAGDESYELIASARSEHDAAIKASLTRETRTRASWQKIAIEEERPHEPGDAHHAAHAEYSSSDSSVEDPDGSSSRPAGPPTWSRANTSKRDPGGYRDQPKQKRRTDPSSPATPSQGGDGGGNSGAFMPRLH